MRLVENLDYHDMVGQIFPIYPLMNTKQKQEVMMKLLHLLLKSKVMRLVKI